MNADQNIHELIDQYLKGQLVGEDMDLFRIRLKEDQTFLRQVQLQKALIQHIEKEREAELKSLFNNQKKKSPSIIPINRRILSIAAIILAITAMAMVLTMYLPSQDLAEDSKKHKVDDPITTDENDTLINVVEGENQNVEETVTEDEASEEIDVADEVPPPQLVEDSPAPVNKEMVLSEDETDELSELRTAENKLDAKDIKAQKDELLIARKHTIYALARNVQTSTTGSTSIRTNEVTSVETVDNKKIKKKETDADVVSPGSVEKKSIDSNAIVQAPGKTITIEYWKSIVNFKGYHYDGNVLMLYDVAPEAKVQIVTLDGKTYMKWGGAVYRMLNNAQYESFSRVTNPDLLNLINK